MKRILQTNFYRNLAAKNSITSKFQLSSRAAKMYGFVRLKRKMYIKIHKHKNMIKKNYLLKIFFVFTVFNSFVCQFLHLKITSIRSRSCFRGFEVYLEYCVSVLSNEWVINYTYIAYYYRYICIFYPGLIPLISTSQVGNPYWNS